VALEAEQEFDPFAGGFPVPPMPGQIAQPSRRTKVTISSGAATRATTETTEGNNV
jgi:NADH-quinone oxidoreductase subunit H